MKTARIITNVGYIRDNNVATFSTAYLGQTNTGELFITARRPEIVVSGVTIPAQWTFVSKDWLTSATVNNIATALVDKLALGTDFLKDEVLSYAGIAVGVIVNDSTVVGLATNYGKAAIADIPQAYTLKGANITDAIVEDISGFDGVIQVTGTGSNGGGSNIIPLSNIVALPELQNDPIGAVTALAKDPIAYAKENPVSAAVVGLAVWEGVAMLTKSKTSPLILLGLRNKPKGK